MNRITFKINGQIFEGWYICPCLLNSSRSYIEAMDGDFIIVPNSNINFLTFTEL
jgi:hypothetical protein